MSDRLSHQSADFIITHNFINCSFLLASLHTHTVSLKLNLSIIHALPAATLFFLFFFFSCTALSWISQCFKKKKKILFLYVVLHLNKTKHSRRDPGVFSQEHTDRETGTERSYEMTGILTEPKLSCSLYRRVFNIFR